MRSEIEQRAKAAPPPPAGSDDDPIVGLDASGPITRSKATRSQFDEAAFARAAEALDADLTAPNPAPKDSWMR
jgi:hypothetical protein